MTVAQLDMTTIDWEARADGLARDIEAQAQRHDADDSFVADAYDALKAAGFFKALVPSELGGGGAEIEEMCRAENLVRDDQIEAEIAVYNELMPTETSLSATLFIELPPDADPVEALNRLVGLDEHVVLHIGPHAIRASFEPGRSTEDKISAVQYTRYPLTDEARAALATPQTPIAVEIDHPHYSHRVACSEELRASLAADYA